MRIGDLVDNAGIIAKVPIFRAPDLGSTGTVSADAVVEAVRAHALIGLDTGDVSEVVVTRASRTIPAKDIEDRIAQALSAQYALGPAKDIAVTFDRELRSDPRRAERQGRAARRLRSITTAAAAASTSRSICRPAPPRAARCGLPAAPPRPSRSSLLARPLERGEVIKSGRHRDRAPPARRDRPRRRRQRPTQAIGFAARASLQPGQPLRSADLMKPELVQRNETVTLVYEVPGITLTVRGKAVEGGAEGDVIAVLNEQSKRTVQGVVAGPGRVVISTSTPRLAANLPPTAIDASD